jgi:hypothetical protein
MKYRLLFFLTSMIIFSCGKDNGPNPALLEKWPQQWIFTIDETVDKYTYLETAGNNMKRSQILKSYSMIQLAEDNECEFNVAQSRTEAGDVCFTIQLNKNKKRWLFAGNSSNQQEVHLGVTNGSSEITAPGDSDNYKFLIHRLNDVNGVTTIAIESIEKPGYYISSASPGFNYSPTQVVLKQQSSPDNATHWQCR